MPKQTISEKELIDAGLKPRAVNQYFIAIDLQYEGVREIVANTTQGGYHAWYQVNGISASKNMHDINEVKELYRALTGKQLP